MPDSWTVTVTFENDNTMTFILPDLFHSLIMAISQAKDYQDMWDEGDIREIVIS